MESYPTGARAFTPSATFANPATTNQADVPARNPIGVWFKTPRDTDADPCTIALAVPLSARFGPLAITIATGIRSRLVSFMARDPHNTDGNTRRYGPGVLAIVTAWPNDCGPLADALESAGITAGGYYKHWQYITGNPSRADLRRSSNRVSKRLSRARAAGDVLTNADIAMTTPSPRPATYKERAHVTRLELEIKKSLSLRDASQERRETPATISPAKAVPIAPELPPAARMIVDRFGWTPAPSKLETIAATVGDDIKTWQYVLDEYVETDHWHKGPNALKGMLERFQRRQLAISATTSQTTAPSDGKQTQSAHFRARMARVGTGQKQAPKRHLTDRERAENERLFSTVIGHSTDFQGSAPAENPPENTEIPGATGAGTARLGPAITLPAPDQWLARTGTSDQAWRAIMVNYRRAHGIGRFESVPIANIEKWALEQANRHSQITMLPIMPGGTR